MHKILQVLNVPTKEKNWAYGIYQRNLPSMYNKISDKLKTTCVTIIHKKPGLVSLNSLLFTMLMLKWKI